VAEIQLKGVTKRYPDGFEAVKQMDLTIGDGEFMILVGPSGCGKSTALRMIAGLEDITDGELSIGGTVVNEKAPKDRDIAMVFQSYALYPHMTVRDNMGFALKLAGVDKAEIDRKVSEAARVLDLEQHLDRKPANLSGGQRQRVAMGRAIVRDPSAFLMDEPLSNLDAKLRVQMRSEVSRIQNRLGTTTVYVTHDQTEAMTLGDRVAVMRAGVLQQVDSPRELYNNPANLFVAGFIGSPAMNFFAGTVEDGKVRLPFGDLPLPEGIQARGAVIAGVRPEDFEDAELAPSDAKGGFTFEAPIELIENMGADLFAHFGFEGGRAQSAELSELAADAGTADVPSASGQENVAVARVSPESRIQQGSTARLWLDTAKLHLFDPKDGSNLRHFGGGDGGAAPQRVEREEQQIASREPEERSTPEGGGGASSAGL
jgi:multiple sugar transport system ATP-binding protein